MLFPSAKEPWRILNEAHHVLSFGSSSLLTGESAHIKSPGLNNNKELIICEREVLMEEHLWLVFQPSWPEVTYIGLIYNSVQKVVNKRKQDVLQHSV